MRRSGTAGFDPVQRAKDVARIVCRGSHRKYRRFRSARFYGGIATADCIGCNLRCLFCWSWDEVVHPVGAGSFCSPQDVARRLVDIARKKRYGQVRISGNEPTHCRDHLLGVLERIPPDLLFILETNGILLGHDATYARDLARFPNLYVRVSLKGTTEEEFGRLTGARPGSFGLQIRAVENLFRAGVRVQPAAMVSFSSPTDMKALAQRLASIAPGLGDLEIEEFVLYGDVEDRLKRARLECPLAHHPKDIPPEQV